MYRGILYSASFNAPIIIGDLLALNLWEIFSFSDYVWLLLILPVVLASAFGLVKFSLPRVMVFNGGE